MEGGHEFTWRDAGRTVAFGAGALRRATDLLDRHGFGDYALLGTARLLEKPPAQLRESAARVLEVAHGQVPDLAAVLLDEVGERDLVAFGGGRVIDVAKAVAAACGGRVAAIPTTLSGAEITGIHRLPVGVEGVAMVRPELVVWDPEALDSLDESRLRATAINALAHGAEALYGPAANPIASLLALEGAGEIAAALAASPTARLGQLAYGSILCAYAIDSAGLGFHHALCQTVVRVCGISHAGAYAALLPATMDWVRPRARAELDRLAEAIGAGEEIGERLRELGGDPPGLGALGAARDRIGEIVATARERPQLERAPRGRPSVEELERMLEAAW